MICFVLFCFVLFCFFKVRVSTVAQTAQQEWDVKESFAKQMH